MEAGTVEGVGTRPSSGEGGEHRLSNGILLRRDIHSLFTPEHNLEVSRRTREEFENGRDYYALHGRSILRTILPIVRSVPH